VETTALAFLHRDDVALYHELCPGDDPAVVFVHGWCCDHSFFAPQLAHFQQQGRTTLALDLRGHGRSDKPDHPYPMQIFADDVAWVCRELALERALIVGHSMGGIVAYDLAARHPGIAGAFVMIDSAVVLPEPARAAIPAALAALRSPRYVEAMRAMVTKSFFIPTDDAGRRVAILNIMAATPQHVMASAFDGLRDYDSEIGRSSIHIPSLFIAADEPSSRSDLAELRGLLPGMHEGRTVGSGHFCMLEVPQQVNAMLDRFEQVSAQSS
jgi:pimeloyl-ACP methyl ester carboxylesterase